MKKAINNELIKNARESLYYISFIFLFLAIIAAVIGFLGLDKGPMPLGETLFYVLIVLFVCSVIMGIINFKSIPKDK